MWTDFVLPKLTLEILSLSGKARVSNPDLVPRANLWKRVMFTIRVQWWNLARP